MHLQGIIERLAEAAQLVDGSTHSPGVNRRTEATYLPGFKSMDETRAIAALDAAWEEAHPGERTKRALEVPFPNSLVHNRTKLDLLFSTEDHCDSSEMEWGLEIKRLQFVGDNGGNGDHEVAKVLSPYLKDRGMLHDAIRLREYGFTRWCAIVAYSFDYEALTLEQAARIHNSSEASQRIRTVRKLVERTGPLYTAPLIEFMDAILRMRGSTEGPRAQAEFEAWQHPVGGRGCSSAGKSVVLG